MKRFRPLLNCLLLAALASSGAADDWPCWRGPRGDGISTETIDATSWPAEGPSVLWRAEVGTGFSSMAAAGALVYTLGYDGDGDVVYCFDAATGEAVWEYGYEEALDDRFFEGGPTSTPTIDGDRVYTLSRQGKLIWFERASGEVIWEINVAEVAGVRAPGWGFAGSPLVHGDLLLLNVGEAGTALNKTTGELVWKSADREAGYATPTVVRQGERDLALIASGKFQIGVDAATGEELWRLRWLTNYGCNAATPIARDGRVFVSSGYNRGAAMLELTDGEPNVVWKNKEMQNQLNTCLLIDGYLYGVHGNEGDAASLRCMDWETGEVAWTYEGLGCGSLTAAGDLLIVLSESGELVVGPASPEGFEPVASVQVLEGKCWTVPVLADGRLYCRSAAGELVCLAVGG